MVWLTNHTFARRLVSISLIIFVAALLLVLAPLWIPIIAIAGLLFDKLRSGLRCLCFICLFLLCELAGIFGSAWLWLQHKLFRTPKQAYLDANSALQFWWAETLRSGAEQLFRLRFVIEGKDALNGPGAIVLPRHTSIGDTILPLSFYAKTKQLKVNYVLKRELLLDPCLDIVGNRLPNVFLNRVAEDMGPELNGLTSLANQASDTDTLVIYMEGTRFSNTKRERILKTLLDKGDQKTAIRAEQWTKLLPIRPAGALALLQGAPNKDLLFLAHTGFEGSASFASLFNGSWLDTTVRLRFWRIKRENIPNDAAGRRTLLLDQWDVMQRAVDEMLAAGQ
jgi:1-acyl-sn-glycerol-3-phosphate acyltransferase